MKIILNILIVQIGVLSNYGIKLYNKLSIGRIRYMIVI